LKRLISIFFILFFILNVFAGSFAGGWGTAESPYLISTAEQLNNIRNHMDKHFKQINNIDLSQYENWNPLGEAFELNKEENITFTGTYDGNNYTILNLTIFRPEETFVGLFRYLENDALIKNINLINVNISGNNRVGGIAGYAKSGTIDNSYVKGKVKGAIRVGGIVGSFSDKAKIYNSSAEIEIYGMQLTGGLVGINYGEIINSSVSGKVEILKKPLIDNNKSLNQIEVIGGIAGFNNGKIINCNYIGDIKGNDFVGGIAGYNLKIIENTFSKGSVIGIYEIGGITGTNKLNGEITNSFSESFVKGEMIVGGISGVNKGKISNSEFLGSLKGDKYVGKYIGINALTGDTDFKNEQKNLFEDTIEIEEGYEIEKPEIKDNLIGKDYRFENNSISLKEKLLKHSKFWGLDGEIKKHISNDIDVEWYEDQLETGDYGSMNCATTSAAMAVNWYNNEIITNGEEARNLYLNDFSIDHGWSTMVITDYLNFYNINFKTYNRHEITIEFLKDELNNGSIMLLGGDMKKITLNARSFEKTASFYSSSADLLHMFVLKGYVETDKNIYFEIFDPATGKDIYLDGTPRGQNRYFDKEDIISFFTEESIKGDGGPLFFIRPKNFEEEVIKKTEEFAGGSGTVEDPYLISSAEQLNNIRNYLDKHFKQINDIDLSEYDNWQPIGNFRAGNGFKGSFDGNSFVINNLNIDRPEEENVGFFEFVQRQFLASHLSPNLKNINIINANINGKNRVGGLVALNSGVIDNCNVSGKINGYKWSGGFVGVNDRTGEISNSSFTGNADGFEQIGGFAGNNLGKIFESYSVTNVNATQHSGGFVGIAFEGEIKNSYSNSNVKGIDCMGGFAGATLEGKIINSYSLGNVEGTKWIGGFIGENNGYITESYSKADVKGIDIVGGFAGSNFNSEITKSYSIGKINGNNLVGGFAGRNSGIISTSYSKTFIQGNNIVGGFVGGNLSKIENCYSLTEVKGVDKTGGFVGWNTEEGVISYSYSAGKIISENNPLVGAFIGNNEGDVKFSYFDNEITLRSNFSGGFGRNTSRMKTKLNYTQNNSWDFENIWEIDENKTYPYFKWQGK